MRAPIAIFLFFLISSLFADTIVQHYTVPAPVLNEIDGKLRIQIEGASRLGPKGGQSLPYLAVRIVLPPGHKACKIELSGASPVEIGQNLELEESPVYQPISNPPNKIPGKKEKPVKNLMQLSPVSTGFLNGISVATAVYTPVFTDQVSNTTFSYKEISLKIITSDDPDAISALANLHPESLKQINFKKHFGNHETIRQYPVAGIRSNGYDYLIITPEEFENEFDTLVEFYHSRGLLAKVYTTEHIDSSYTGVDEQERIREFIISEYQGNAIEFVLMGGDTVHVPSRGFYCQVQSSSVYTSYDMPSDLYYAALDGNWNDDNDSQWGEPGEEDLYPEVSIGRFPFADTAELRNMIHKTIVYQGSPVISDIEKPLMLGEHLWSSPETWGSDYMDLLLGAHGDNGYNTSCIPGFHNIDSLYDRAATWSGSTLMSRVNSGISAIHHCGHSNYYGVMKLGVSNITNSNFALANGIDHHFPIVYTHGCNCGGFDKDDCIGEKMVLIDNFASAFIGNSRYGWFIEGTTEGPAEHLHREFLDAMYSDSLYWIGTALKESRIMSAPWVDLPGEYEPGAYRWNFYDINILGDPAMAMWTYEPMDFKADYREIVPIGCDSLQLHLERDGIPLKYFQCAIFEGDSLFGTTSTDSLGNAVIHFTGELQQGTVALRVSGYNILTVDLDLHIADIWLGYSNDWSEASNWQSNTLPNEDTYIVIPSNPLGGNFPESNSLMLRECAGVYVESGANFVLTNGETLDVQGE